jgi:XTP/dITP diphosphohydrolase
MKLVFATHNPKKLVEVREILPSQFQIESLSDLNFLQDIIEDADTFQGNALIKAKTIFNLLGESCFADDSGLVVPTLGGLPGVKSARYANDEGPVDHMANNVKLLKALKDKTDRRAYFITVICLILKNEDVRYFEGRVEGTISESLMGDKGFGYDPIFIPNGYNRTFGELGADVKNNISHRARALNKMRDFFIDLN